MASSTSLGLLLLRLSLGLMYLAHAGLKLFVFTLPGTAQFFAGVGLPGALAYAVFAAEAVGAVLLLAGAWPRQVALALLPVLLGAAWVHGRPPTERSDRSKKKQAWRPGTD